MRRFALGALALGTLACSSAAPPMTRSCRGEYVDECRPYTYAQITNATLDPQGITLGDATMQAHVHVDFTRCDMGTDLPLTVQISAFVGATGDGSIPDPDDTGVSSDARVIPLTTVGPPAMGSNSIDVMIDNPFFAQVPANTRIQLQFAPIIDDCEGDLFSESYRTGPVVATP